MSGANRLITSMAGLGKNSVSAVLFGRVTNVEPLIIVRDGSESESRAPLTAEFLVLSKTCKEFRINNTAHTHSISTGTTGSSLETLLIWPGLKVGERVILISLNDNQRYFVERLEKLENEV